MTVRKFLGSLTFLLATVVAQIACAETITAKGSAEVSVRANKGDLIATRRVARNEAEADAIIAAIKLKLNLNPNDEKSKAAVWDLVKQLSDNLKTTYQTEGDVVTAKTSLEVDSNQLFDLAKSLGLGSQNQVAAAKVLFIIDEYIGISTSQDPSQPIETSMEYSHDKSSFSDKSAKASGADSQSASSNSARASASSGASTVSSRASAAVSAKDSASYKSKSSVTVNAKASESGSYKGSAAVATREGNDNSYSAGESLEVSGNRSGSYKGSASAEDSAKRTSSYSASSASKYEATSASKKSSATASASANASASSYSTDQKDIAEQKDIVNIKANTKFPDVNNAKPSEGADELVAARLEEVSQKHGLQFTSERDFRIEGGRRMLIKDIEKAGQYDYYMQKASKGSFRVKYLVYGTAVMNAEGKTPSGDVKCTGQLKVQSSNVDTGGSLFSGTINKTAVGSSDQNCRANLSSALATELAEKIGTTAQREIQRAGTQGQSHGQSYEVTLYSVLKVPFKVKKNFSEQLQKMTDEFIEGNATDTARNFTVQAKGSFKTKVEDLMEEMRDSFPEMKEARLESKGNRLVVCIEGKCPTE